MHISIADKVLRLSMTTYPFINESQFFPALSTYTVDRVFDLTEFERALTHFFRGNPLFAKCELIELTFDSPEDFPLSAFQGLLSERYESFADSLLVASVTYRSEPHTQGIFTCVPFPLQDGYKCFRFHQSLMKTLKTGQDEFLIARGLAELGIRADELAEFLPPVETSRPGGVSELPVGFVESCAAPTKIGPYLERMKTEFLERDSENMFVLKNSLYAPELPLGNSLLFLTVPRSVVERSTGMQIRDHYHAEEKKQIDLLSGVESRDEFIQAGQARIGKMIATPNVFCVNNYGNVSAHDGSDVDASHGTLMKYQWHMPMLVLGIAAGARSGLSFTITVRDKAFNFRTVPPASRPTAAEGWVGTRRA
ncbi:hypothetical protein [Nocardia arizonensis]|uniref:hypothetical protein n=1 Tax=Nocardia arizonensis TaxID=1141647 RepID=UPI0006D023E1|nr:hypothetical protein [Nocardia arizonensis]